VFDEFDDNGDGVLSRSEFGRAMGKLDLEVTKDETEQLMREFDRDDKGVVSVKDFIGFVLKGGVPKRSIKVLSEAETGGGGGGSDDDELCEGAKVEAKCKGRGGRHYPGNIYRDNGDGTFCVKFDDGDSESELVLKRNIKVLSEEEMGLRRRIRFEKALKSFHLGGKRRRRKRYLEVRQEKEEKESAKKNGDREYNKGDRVFAQWPAHAHKDTKHCINTRQNTTDEEYTTGSSDEEGGQAGFVWKKGRIYEKQSWVQCIKCSEWHERKAGQTGELKEFVCESKCVKALKPQINEDLKKEEAVQIGAVQAWQKGDRNTEKLLKV
jgi:hypothetical protein